MARLTWEQETHVFDVWTGVDGDHIAVLDAEVVANDAVDPGAAVVEALVGQYDENCVLSLLAANEDGVASEELEVVHGGL